MIQIVIAIAVAAVVSGLALLLRRRPPAPPTQPHWQPPVQLDRHDFADPEKTWLVVVFSSDVCDSCPKAVTTASLLASKDVAFENVTLQARPDLHNRYTIMQVPLVLVADNEGVVRLTYTGPPNSAELWAEFAHVREHVDAG